eukprot:GEMP01014290.1.p1 GENE.GEMP01014290.1~~GEMP01014290.1.p1  ORF type:complete len:757 (+),score=176.66 GEMP01014290.1:131-2272(+)
MYSPSLHVVLDARCATEAVFNAWMLALHEISGKLQSLLVVRDLGFTVLLDPADHTVGQERKTKVAFAKAHRLPKENCPRTAWLEYPTTLDTSTLPPKKRKKVEGLILQKRREIEMVQKQQKSQPSLDMPENWERVIGAIKSEWPLATVGIDPQVLALEHASANVTENALGRHSVELWCHGAARRVIKEEDIPRKIGRPVDVMWADGDLEFLSKIREKHGDIGKIHVAINGWDKDDAMTDVTFSSAATGFADQQIKLQYVQHIAPDALTANELYGMQCVFYTNESTVKEWHGLIACGGFCPFQLIPTTYDSFFFFFELREVVVPDSAYKFQVVMRGLIDGPHMSLTADDYSPLERPSNFPMHIYNQIPLYSGPPLTSFDLHRIFDADHLAQHKYLFANLPSTTRATANSSFPGSNNRMSTSKSDTMRVSSKVPRTNTSAPSHMSPLPSRQHKHVPLERTLNTISCARQSHGHPQSDDVVMDGTAASQTPITDCRSTVLDDTHATRKRTASKKANLVQGVPNELVHRLSLVNRRAAVPHQESAPHTFLNFEDDFEHDSRKTPLSQHGNAWARRMQAQIQDEVIPLSPVQPTLSFSTLAQRVRAHMARKTVESWQSDQNIGTHASLAHKMDAPEDLDSRDATCVPQQVAAAQARLHHEVMVSPSAEHAQSSAGGTLDQVVQGTSVAIDEAQASSSSHGILREDVTVGVSSTPPCSD